MKKINLQLKVDLTFIYTEGIGDGGNNLGMGKVKDVIHSDIPNGRLIACAIASCWAGNGLWFSLQKVSFWWIDNGLTVRQSKMYPIKIIVTFFFESWWQNTRNF